MSELLNYLVQNEADFRKARLPALYSDFLPQRTLNPDGYAANVAAWKHGLSAAALAGHAPSKSSDRSHFTIELDDALLRSLESKQYGQPLSLGVVLNEAVAHGEMMPLQHFINSKESVLQKPGWGSLPWSIIKWGLRQVGLIGSGGDGKMPKGKFVVMANLDQGAQRFGQKNSQRTSRVERIFSMSHFKRTFEGAVFDGRRLSESDIDILIKFLSRDKGMVATDGKTIKIREAQAEDATITEEDSAIASLKELMEDLVTQTENLSKRIDDLSITAKEAVMKKNRVSALAALRSKKLAESNLATRYATLNQLEEVATKIGQAADNVALVKVMQSSTIALRNLNSQVGGVDKVDEMFENLRQRMGEVDEVGNIIADGGLAATVDESEVDEEFEAMLAEEMKKEKELARKRRELEEATAREKKEVQEAEDTRRKLAELDRLGPRADKDKENLGKNSDTAEQVELAQEMGGRTPAADTADTLGDMSLEERMKILAE